MHEVSNESGLEEKQSLRAVSHVGNVPNDTNLAVEKVVDSTDSYDHPSGDDPICLLSKLVRRLGNGRIMYPASTSLSTSGDENVGGCVVDGKIKVTPQLVVTGVDGSRVKGQGASVLATEAGPRIIGCKEGGFERVMQGKGSKMQGSMERKRGAEQSKLGGNFATDDSRCVVEKREGCWTSEGQGIVCSGTKNMETTLIATRNLHRLEFSSLTDARKAFHLLAVALMLPPILAGQAEMLAFALEVALVLLLFLEAVRATKCPRVGPMIQSFVDKWDVCILPPELRC